MKNRLRSVISLSLLLLLVLAGISACDKDSPTTPSTPPAPSGVITGSVYAPGKAALSGVTVKSGTISTTTDAFGMYQLNNVPTGTNVQVDFEFAGYISLQKTVDVINAKTSYLSCTMFQAVTATLPAVSGGSVYESGAEIALPANAFVDANNVPFTGTVRAEVKYFDPTNAENLEAFPGTFSGIMDGETTAFESYGFISAKFFDNAKADSPLRLAPGKTASLIAPIPWSLQGNAPSTIPLWYYDETQGTWIAEGTATRVGNQYEGEVSHFTYWNFDHPITVNDQATLQGYVKWTNDTGDPVVSAQVVATGVDYSGYTRVYTDGDGFFSISVKANSQVKLRAYLGQNSTSANPPAISTPVGGATNTVNTLVMTDDSFILQGRILNSDNTPFASGWGNISKVGTSEQYGDFQTDAEGYFSTRIYSSNTKAAVSVIFSTGYHGNRKYSNPVSFTEPAVGQVITITNPIIVGDGGNITAICKDSSGNLITEAWVNFMTEGGGQEEMFGETDSNGRITISGAPGSVLYNVTAHTYFNDTSYVSQSTYTLTFPSAGQTTDLGIITFVVDNTPDKK